MIRPLILSATLSATLALPAQAAVFTAENNAKVVPAGGGSFIVKPERRFGVPGQWCGAADYARKQLGAGWTDRIYVRGQQGRDVVFSLSPGGNAPKSIFSIARSAKVPGSNFSVQRAYALCIDQRVPHYLFGRP